MEEKKFTNLKALLRDGKYAEAEEQLNVILKETSDDRQAKMLYGTCRLMQGDTETAKKIQAEIEAHYEETPDIPPEEKSFWQKYKKLILYTAGAALVLAETATVAAAAFGGAVKEMFRALSSGPVFAEPTDAKYGGPPVSQYEYMSTVHNNSPFTREREALTPSEKVSPCPADKHDWITWSISSDGIQSQYCRRCSKKRELSPCPADKHEWETLYTIPLQNGKLEKQSCRRCHTTREVLPPPCAGDKHEWECFEDGKSGAVYRCRQCGSKQNKN